jgi:ATP-dependent Clp protease adaptor protein ClpS
MSEPRRRGPSEPSSSTGTLSATRTLPRKDVERKQLPPFRVLLHNDDVNEMNFVVRTIVELVHLSKPAATQRMMEAHTSGVSLLTVTHKERAELYVDQFATKGLTVTIEPAV